MKVRTVYIGFVMDKINLSAKSVSASNSKRVAGELMQKWLDKNDPDRLDYIEGGVDTVSDSDYINLEANA